jgi:hypothetical protein
MVLDEPEPFRGWQANPAGQYDHGFRLAKKWAAFSGQPLLLANPAFAPKAFMSAHKLLILDPNHIGVAIRRNRFVKRRHSNAQIKGKLPMRQPADQRDPRRILAKPIRLRLSQGTSSFLHNMRSTETSSERAMRQGNHLSVTALQSA